MTTAKVHVIEVQAVLQGVPFMGVQVVRYRRLILLHEKKVRGTAKTK